MASRRQRSRKALVSLPKIGSPQTLTFSDKFSQAFDGGLTRDGQLAIAPRTTAGLTSVTAKKATLIHQAMCQSAAVTPMTVSKTLTDKIE